MIAWRSSRVLYLILAGTSMILGETDFALGVSHIFGTEMGLGGSNLDILYFKLYMNCRPMNFRNTGKKSYIKVHMQHKHGYELEILPCPHRLTA